MSKYPDWLLQQMQADDNYPLVKKGGANESELNIFWKTKWTEGSIVNINVNEDHFQQARDRSVKKIIKHSVKGTHANMIGALGEVMFEQWLTNNNIQFEDLAHKMSDDYKVSNTTVEVKTKLRTVKPKRDYSVSVTKYNHHRQSSDYFIFINIQKNRDTNKIHSAQVVGGCQYGKFSEVGRHLNKGDVRSNGTVIPIDAINVYMGQLEPPSVFVNNYINNG